MVEIKITNEQKVQVSLAPVTATGNPAVLDGAPIWAVVSGDAALDVAADGLSAFLISSAAPGESMISISADADLGSGIENLAESVKLVTEGARAVNLGLSIATPVTK